MRCECHVLLMNPHSRTHLNQFNSDFWFVFKGTLSSSITISMRFLYFDLLFSKTWFSFTSFVKLSAYPTSSCYWLLLVFLTLNLFPLLFSKNNTLFWKSIVYKSENQWFIYPESDTAKNWFECLLAGSFALVTSIMAGLDYNLLWKLDVLPINQLKSLSLYY